MDRSEVTVEAYAGCVKAGKCSEAGSTPNGLYEARGDICNVVDRSRKKHPINCVDFKQAETYCKARGARLPTEVEWEWSARGGNKGWNYPWGQKEPEEGDSRQCSTVRTTCPVGSFSAGDNPWGIHDLIGNVAEWTTTEGKNDQRVIKGGDYRTYESSKLTSAHSTDDDPNSRTFGVGFRCVKAPPAPVAADDAPTFYVSPKVMARVKNTKMCSDAPASMATAIDARMKNRKMAVVSGERDEHDFNIRLTLDVERGRHNDYVLLDVIRHGLTIQSFKTTITISDACAGFEEKSAVTLVAALQKWIPESAAATAAAEKDRPRLESAEKDRLAAATAEADFPKYEKLNTPAGWVEFLVANSSSIMVPKARQQLAESLRKTKDVSVGVAATGPSIKCEGGSVTFSEMNDNMHIVGNKWVWQCQNPGSFSFHVHNPTPVTIYVRGTAHDEVFDALVGPGKTVSGAVRMRTACANKRRQADRKIYAAGRVTFLCNDAFDLVVAAPAEDEAKKFSKILTETNDAVLRSFLTDFPASALVPMVRGRLDAIQLEANDALIKQIKATAKLGPKPAKLVDGQTYTLTLENPTPTAARVTVEHEAATSQEVEVPAHGSTSLDLMTKPSSAPSYRVKSARMSKP
jgi:hypothetical protein